MQRVLEVETGVLLGREISCGSTVGSAGGEPFDLFRVSVVMAAENADESNLAAIMS